MLLRLPERTSANSIFYSIEENSINGLFLPEGKINVTLIVF
jgi:hypothetical protein